MKKIFFFIIIFITVLSIYKLTINKKVYYLTIGDSLVYKVSKNIKKSNKIDKYINYSTLDDYRLMDLINDINYNKLVSYNNKEYNLQHLLVKANVICISIGTNDLIYKNKLTNITYDYIDQLLNDMDDLFKILRKYNKDKIYFLGFNDIINNEEIINYINNRIRKICKKYKIIYVDTISNYDLIITKVLNFTKN